MGPNGGYKGWGILYSSENNNIQLGWWDNQKLNGNCIYTNNQWSIIEKGWYEIGKRTGVGKPSNNQYKIFNINNVICMS